MTADAWITAAVVLLILVGLVIEVASPAILTFSGVVVLLVTGVVEAEGALSGFSNPAPFVVGSLFVVARAITKTGAIRPLTNSLMGEKGNTRRPMLRMLAPTTIASAFMNNIPLVAMMIPEVTAWARRRGNDVSRFLLPLSFGAIFGGLLTVIGTSTNLVVLGQMQSLGVEPFDFFELAVVGLPIAVFGVVTLVAVSPRLLKGRHSPGQDLDEESQEFAMEMVVTPGGPLDGSTVESGGLRHLQGVFLAAIDRGSSIVAPTRPATPLNGGDRLLFVGRVDHVLDLRERPGLQHADESLLRHFLVPGTRYFVAVVGAESPLVGTTLRDIGFRSRYDAAVVAIHRSGSRLREKLGEALLRPGDALVVLADETFRRRWSGRSDFLVISQLGEDVEPVAPGRWRTLAVLAGMILVAATGWVPILHASLVAAVLMMALRVITPDEARRALDLEVLGVIAAAFGLAAAIRQSGLDQVIADGLISAFGVFGEAGVLLGVVVATIALTELVTNNAAALLMLPVGLTAASAADVSPRGMSVAVAIAASASFLTPLGYQTNTMVYGPGGYSVKDYVKVGAPITLLVVIVLTVLIPVVY